MFSSREKKRESKREDTGVKAIGGQKTSYYGFGHFLMYTTCSCKFYKLIKFLGLIVSEINGIDSLPKGTCGKTVTCQTGARIEQIPLTSRIHGP